MRFRKPVDDLDREFPESAIDELHDKSRAKIAKDLHDFVKKASSGQTQEEFWHRWAQIREMLFHLNERVNYWEGRRTQFLQIGIGLLAASIAGVVAIFSNISELTDLFFQQNGLAASTMFLSAKGILYIFAFIVCMCFTVGCLWLLLLWNEQNNPSYPFTKACRTWLWHYRHAEKSPLETDFRTYTPATYRTHVETFAANLVHYKKRLLQSDVQELLDQDISQVYVLLINEKFKIKMVNRLRDCLLSTTRLAFYTSISTMAVLFGLRLVLLLA